MCTELTAEAPFETRVYTLPDGSMLKFLSKIRKSDDMVWWRAKSQRPNKDVAWEAGPPLTAGSPPMSTAQEAGIPCPR